VELGQVLLRLLQIYLVISIIPVLYTRIHLFVINTTVQSRYGQLLSKPQTTKNWMYRGLMMFTNS